MTIKEAMGNLFDRMFLIQGEDGGVIAEPTLVKFMNEPSNKDAMEGKALYEVVRTQLFSDWLRQHDPALWDETRLQAIQEADQ